jgi:hypothetical protein
MNPSNITLNIADIDFSSYGIYEIDTIITGLKRGYILFDQTAFYNLIKQFKQLSMPEETYTLGISHFHSDLETLTDLIELKLKFLHNSDLKSILKNSLFVLETLSNMTLDRVIKYNKTGITTEARAKITELFSLIFDFLLWDDQDTAQARANNNIIGANLMDFMSSGYSGKLPKAQFWNLGNIKEFEVALENSIAQCIYSMQPEDKQESEAMMHLLKNPAY